MLFLRVAGLMLLVCLHVFGGAVLFRKLFPRESPWCGFFLPALALVFLLNFLEHIVALPVPFLLPFSIGLSVWLMAKPDRSWRKLQLPGLLFLGAFGFALTIKCLQPDVNYFNTEGLTDLNRILDFCLGDRLPPTDCWLTPYPHVGYYTFMHYGASVMKRLFCVDIGTGYNLSFAFVNALTLLAAAATAHGLSRYRNRAAVLVLIVMAGGFAGSTPFRALANPLHPSPASTTDIGVNWNDPTQNGFSWLLKREPPRDAYRMFPPGCYIYYTEFHATVGGQFILLLAAFAAVEALRRKRTVFPWIFLVVAPFLMILTCPWLFFMAALLCWPTFWMAWWVGRRPPHWNHVFLGSAIALGLLWPTFTTFALDSRPQDFNWSFQGLIYDRWMVFIQWWPIYVPWFALFFGWKRLNLAARWLFLGMGPMFLLVETIWFSGRGICLEKTWGSCFGLALAILYPLVFVEKGRFFRGLSAVLVATGLICAAAWTKVTYQEVNWVYMFLHLEGNSFIREDPQLVRMSEVLSRLHGQTVLTGKSTYAFFESPCLPAFTENRCYLGWTNAEETTGHPEEAQARQKLVNSFYDGTLADPLGFLKANGVTAVLVYPDDQLTDDFVGRLIIQLGPEYTYFDCREKGQNNAGVFLKKLL